MTEIQREIKHQMIVKIEILRRSNNGMDILPCPKCANFKQSDIFSKRLQLRADEVRGNSHQAKVVSLLFKLIFYL